MSEEKRDEGDEKDAAVVFTPEQTQEMIRIQNAATVTHNTRMQKIMDAKMEDMSKTFLSTLDQLKETIAGIGEPLDGGDEKKKISDEDAIRAKYEARIAQVEKRADAAESRRAEEEQKAKVAQERQRLNAALSEAGVDKGRVRAAVALLYTEDNRVGRDADNEITFKMQRDGYVDDLTLEDGIGEWLKSDEGKHFAPPMGARGSGAEGGRPGRQAADKPTRQDLENDLMMSILESEGIGAG